jgi:hypothetical protein
MRTAAGLVTDQAGKLLSKFNTSARRSFRLKIRIALGVSAVDLKNLLGQIQSDGGNLFHGTAAILWL